VGLPRSVGCCNCCAPRRGAAVAFRAASAFAFRAASAFAFRAASALAFFSASSFAFRTASAFALSAFTFAAFTFACSAAAIRLAAALSFFEGAVTLPVEADAALLEEAAAAPLVEVEAAAAFLAEVEAAAAFLAEVEAVAAFLAEVEAAAAFLVEAAFLVAAEATFVAGALRRVRVLPPSALGGSAPRGRAFAAATSAAAAARDPTRASSGSATALHAERCSCGGGTAAAGRSVSGVVRRTRQAARSSAGEKAGQCVARLWAVGRRGGASGGGVRGAREKVGVGCDGGGGEGMEGSPRRAGGE